MPRTRWLMAIGNQAAELSLAWPTYLTDNMKHTAGEAAQLWSGTF